MARPPFSLGPILGPICNVVSTELPHDIWSLIRDFQIGLAFTVLTTVFFLFPPDLPVTGSNMNYAVVVLGVIGELSRLLPQEHYANHRTQLSFPW